MTAHFQITFTDSAREKSLGRVAICGPTGSGKSVGSLLLARGLVGEDGIVFAVDTESGSLTKSRRGDIGTSYPWRKYDMKPPFSAEHYVAAIQAALDLMKQEQPDPFKRCLIIDSWSHSWSAEGGLLDRHSYYADKKGENSFAAWRHVTPLHNEMVERVVRADCHVIVTMRAKMAYAMVDDEDSNQGNRRKRTKVEKIGLEPVARNGVEYEFDVVLDVDGDHAITSSKDRTGLFDQRVVRGLKADHGRELAEWLAAEETGERKTYTSDVSVDADRPDVSGPQQQRRSNPPAGKPQGNGSGTLSPTEAMDIIATAGRFKVDKAELLGNMSLIAGFDVERTTQFPSAKVDELMQWLATKAPKADAAAEPTAEQLAEEEAKRKAEAEVTTEASE